MTKEPFKIFSYNEYTLGEIGICREPHTIAEFNNVKAWDACNSYHDTSRRIWN